MKITPLVAFFLSLTYAAVSAEKALPLPETPPSIAEPDFKAPLDESFSVACGEWAPLDDEITAVNLPEQKHIPVLHHLVGYPYLARSRDEAV